MIIFLALLPAVGWGLMPVIAKINKGKPNEQLLGTAITALLFGIILQIILKSEFSGIVFFISFLSGILWSIGQYLQFYSFLDLHVSEAMPISNGTQLIGTSLMAAVFFDEWADILSISLGILSLLIIVVGINLTSYHEKKEKRKINWKPIFILLLSSASLTMYVVLPKFFSVSGSEIIFPQAIGMFTLALVLNLKRVKDINRKKVIKNMTTGLAWSIANTSLFIVMPILGIGRSFTISQLAVLVSLSVSLLIFKIEKTNKERIMIFIGATLTMIGILLISLLKVS